MRFWRGKGIARTEIKWKEKMLCAGKASGKRVMKNRKLRLLLVPALAALLLSGCGSSGDAGNSSDESDGIRAEESGADEESADSGTGSGGTDEAAGEDSGSENISWTWGAANGLSGSAEYTYNDQGYITDIRLYQEGNGALYRHLVYYYDSEWSDLNESGCASHMQTLDGGGNLLYNMAYTWSAGESDDWYISYEYGYDYLREETTSSYSYQELSHLVLNSTSTNMMGRSSYYWITEWDGDKRSETHVYARDGHEDEDLQILWEYEGDTLLDAQIGRYGTVYEAAVGEDGTITLTRDESHQGESKFLTQVYEYTMSYTSEGLPSEYSYHFYKEYENTEEPDDLTDRLVFAYEDGKLGSVTCTQETWNYQDRTFLYDEAGNLVSEDNMQKSLGGGDIGSASYSYYDNGILSAMYLYNAFTPGEASDILQVWRYDEAGVLSAREEWGDGKQKNCEYYGENGNVIQYDNYSTDSDGNIYLSSRKRYDENGYTTESVRYWEDGSIYSQTVYNEHGMYTSEYQADSSGVCSMEGSMTGDNEYTVVYYNSDGSVNTTRVYTYGTDTYSYVEYDGSGAEKSRQENAAYPQ